MRLYNIVYGGASPWNALDTPNHATEAFNILAARRELDGKR